jgi:hypothetical protein
MNILLYIIACAGGTYLLWETLTWRFGGPAAMKTLLLATAQEKTQRLRNHEARRRARCALALKKLPR